MAGGRRELPRWMAATEKVAPRQPARKRGKVARTVYCMNEAELVEAAAAAAFRADGNRGDGASSPGHEVKRGKAMVHIEVNEEKLAKPEETAAPTEIDAGDFSDRDTRERTYVSETDVDIADAETLPYHCNPQPQSEGHRSRRSLDQSPVAVEPGAERTAEHQPPPATGEEDEAFRLVREIFFT